MHGAAIVNGALMTNVYGWLPVALNESVAVTVTEQVPVVDGVPLMTPVLALSDTPHAVKLPVVRLQV